jgi:pantetheine-phosphate adenylyltransferase/dephospho-CoA kinase
MKKAIYAFSGDPITYGHIDIIARATKVFDEVVVGVGANPSKKYMFTLDQRTEMARRSLRGIPHVKVVSFEGLLVDYAYEHEIPVIIKGVRNASDFDYELVLHHLGGSQNLNIDTFLLPARQDLSHVSSSGVKALQQEQGLIHEYVPLYVKMCLEAKISGQYIIGITGEIGTGKSFVSDKLVEAGKKRHIPVHHIELDHIGHQITGDLKEPSYENVRRKIIEQFGPSVGLPGGSINRKVLGEIVFRDRNKLEELNAILYTPLLVRLRRELYSKKGVVLFNAALILESEMSYLCNNNVVLVTADKESQKRRLEDRNLNPSQIRTRLKSQFDEEEKKARLVSEIEKNGQGKLWAYDNSDSSDTGSITRLFDCVLSEIDVFGEMRFKSVWEGIGAQVSYETEYDRIASLYSAKAREYHNLAHVLSGLADMNEAESESTDPLILELAWWYHDIVYDPSCASNEEKSSIDMKQSLASAGVREETISKATELIMWTRHKDLPEEMDARIIVDTDLAILGKEESTYADYETKIRKEYCTIQDEDYKRGRVKFLTDMLSRKTIYQTELFREKYEAKARANIQNTIARLEVR